MRKIASLLAVAALAGGAVLAVTAATASASAVRADGPAPVDVDVNVKDVVVRDVLNNTRVDVFSVTGG
ncbi:hypothetical protein Skr01_12350 [Sphaerisporangium krabiense]|uniref:Uncharacterized protein n=1 Tax=Sphaerisporangium krabiense TaxID=763782 RepID=A0A7W9DTU3_9ACTN|nr:hypothetical protein [Sphaerisporangium krabiense]MBB5631237.1 hypothetical protein [Sphaerisporangium krabiense]GII61150.1 hypothetical protein Skr01_12350 [Sphaerisporangium krabiense]